MIVAYIRLSNDQSDIDRQKFIINDYINRNNITDNVEFVEEIVDHMDFVAVVA